MEVIYCHICGKEIMDMGSHPVVCLSKSCIKEAYLLGWWDMSAKDLAKVKPIDKARQKAVKTTAIRQGIGKAK